jgi:hypothetical protein
MRHVISSGTAESILGVALDGKRELSRTRRRLGSALVTADPELSGPGPDVRADRFGVTVPKIRATGVQRLVTG